MLTLEPALRSPLISQLSLSALQAEPLRCWNTEQVPATENHQLTLTDNSDDTLRSWDHSYNSFYLFRSDPSTHSNTLQVTLLSATLGGCHWTECRPGQRRARTAWAVSSDRAQSTGRMIPSPAQPAIIQLQFITFHILKWYLRWKPIKPGSQTWNKMWIRSAFVWVQEA